MWNGKDMKMNLKEMKRNLAASKIIDMDKCETSTFSARAGLGHF